MANQFDASEIEALKYYVYVYSDPRNGNPFYIGKGLGNRAFAHLVDVGETAKVARIREIRESGFEPKIEILAFGLDETTALKVEAAAIDLVGLENLTNLVIGHGASRFGRMAVDEVHAKLSSKPVEAFEHECVLIRIRDSWAESSKQSPIDLYDATRGSWKVGRDNTDKARFALAVYGGIVREVYEIAAWLPAESTMYVDQTHHYAASTRLEFVGRLAPEPIRSLYRWKSVAHLFKPGAANPIMYVGPKGEVVAAPDEAIETQLGGDGRDDTLIVAARFAYQEYLDTAAYICQPERYFRESAIHLGFYNGGEIKPEIATILYVEESVIFSAEESARRLGSAHPEVRRVGELIEESLRSGKRLKGHAYKVLLLSAVTDARTLRLSKPVANDTVTLAGKPWAWTLGQRYTSSAALARRPRVTSELESPEVV